MTAYVALLRAVNLGGATQVSMGKLREVLEQMGLTKVRSILNSGNLVFETRDLSGTTLEQRLEATVAKSLNFHTEFFVRSASEWGAILQGNPFHRESEVDPGHLLVTVLKAAPAPAAWKALDAAIQGPERVSGSVRHAYIVYPEGTGRSRLTATLIERCLGTRGTSRNWNTVGKLQALLSP
jgi:uncharacterized protein (DUF1697 family)